jgi:hypothetical protein
MLSAGCFKELLQHNTLLMEKATRMNLVTFYMTHILASSCRLDNPPLCTHVIEQNLVCPYAKTYLASPAGRFKLQLEHHSLSFGDKTKFYPSGYVNIQKKWRNTTSIFEMSLHDVKIWVWCAMNPSRILFLLRT